MSTGKIDFRTVTKIVQEIINRGETQDRLPASA
jgi:hypothetical protein